MKITARQAVKTSANLKKVAKQLNLIQSNLFAGKYETVAELKRVQKSVRNASIIASRAAEDIMSQVATVDNAKKCIKAGLSQKADEVLENALEVGANSTLLDRQIENEIEANEDVEQIDDDIEVTDDISLDDDSAVATASDIEDDEDLVEDDVSDDNVDEDIEIESSDESEDPDLDEDIEDLVDDEEEEVKFEEKQPVKASKKSSQIKASKRASVVRRANDVGLAGLSWTFPKLPR